MLWNNQIKSIFEKNLYPLVNPNPNLRIQTSMEYSAPESASSWSRQIVRIYVKDQLVFDVCQESGESEAQYCDCFRPGAWVDYVMGLKRKAYEPTLTVKNPEAFEPIDDKDLFQ